MKWSNILCRPNWPNLTIIKQLDLTLTQIQFCIHSSYPMQLHYIFFLSQKYVVVLENEFINNITLLYLFVWNFVIYHRYLLTSGIHARIGCIQNTILSFVVSFKLHSACYDVFLPTYQVNVHWVLEWINYS